MNKCEIMLNTSQIVYFKQLFFILNLKTMSKDFYYFNEDASDVKNFYYKNWDSSGIQAYGTNAFRVGVISFDYVLSIFIK